MREKAVTIFESFDGLSFESAAACREHEKTNAWRRLVGLTEERVLTAIAYHDVELAEALETIGALIVKTRLAKGVRRRVRRRAADDEPQLPQPVGRPMTAEVG